MRVKYKDIDIECTVDEFEEMVARGLLGEKPVFDPDDFVKKWNELGIDPPKKDERPQDSPFDVVMVYGVHLPNGGYKPVWPNKTFTGQDLTFTATDNTTGTTIQPTQDTATSATIKIEKINQDNPNPESSYPHRRPAPPSPPPREVTVKSWAEFTKEK